MQPYNDKIPVQNPYYQPPVGDRTWAEWAGIYNDAPVEDIPQTAGLSSTSGGIAAILQAISQNTGNSQYFHEIQTMLMAWLQELNKRDYDAELLRDERAYNQWATKEQREYNEGIRDEQRAYDAPTALLNRLMQTGLSRNAALEMLKGMSGGSSGAIGAASPIASPSAQPAGAPGGSSSASNSAEFANYAAGAASIAQGLNSLVNTVGGVMSLPTLGQTYQNAVLQNQLLSSNVYGADLQHQATQSVGNFLGAVYANSPEGVPYARPAEADLLSSEGLWKFAEGVSQEQNPVLYSFMRSPAAKSLKNNPFAWNLLDNTFATHVNSQQQRLANDAVINSELLQIRLDAQKVDLEQVTRANIWEEFKFEDYKMNRDSVNEYNRLHWIHGINTMRMCNDPETLKYTIEAYKKDQQFMAYQNSWRANMQKYVNDTMDISPEWSEAAKLCYMLDTFGFKGEVGTAAKAAGLLTGGLAGTVSRFSNQGEDSHPIQDFIQNFTDDAILKRLREFLKVKPDKSNPRVLNQPSPLPIFNQVPNFN